MSGKRSRDKGKRGELELAHIFTDAGLPMKRKLVDADGQEDGDLENDLNLYIEGRYRERWDIPTWLREIAAEAKGRDWILAFRKNHMDWHVALPLTDYIQLLKEARTDGT